MRSLLLIGNDLSFGDGFSDYLAAHGLGVQRFKSINQSLGHIENASAVIVESSQSAEPLFSEFLARTEHIPKIVISTRCPSKGTRKWLKSRLAYPLVQPTRHEVMHALIKAISDGELYVEAHALRASLESARKELQLLEEVSRILTSAVDLDVIIETIMTRTVDVTRAKGWSLYLLDEDSHRLYLEKTHRKSSGRKRNVSLGIGEGIAGWVVREGIPVVIPDVNADTRFRPEGRGKQPGKKSIICVPLMSKGKALGALEIESSPRGVPFTRDDLGIVMKLVDLASLAIERASLYQKMADLVITDDLTKLFNARYLNRTIENEIARCDRYKSSVSLIFMDIDYFKKINDTYGHLVGSKVLVEVGQLLLKGLRTVDTVSRYGGDEFVVVLPQTPPPIAVQIAERLRRHVNRNLFLKAEGLNLRLTASFGVASYPESSGSKDELLRMADQAMYNVKNRSRDGVYAIPVIG